MGNLLIYSAALHYSKTIPRYNYAVGLWHGPTLLERRLPCRGVAFFEHPCPGPLRPHRHIWSTTALALRL